MDFHAPSDLMLTLSVHLCVVVSEPELARSLMERFTSMAAAAGSGAAPVTVGGPSTRSEALGVVGAALLGAVVVTGGAASPASAASTADANKKLSS